MILTGGRSSRMGRDKAKVRLAGRALVSWVARAAAVAGFRVLRPKPDRRPDCGPLGGMETALMHLGKEESGCLFLSCDMPLVRPELLVELGRRHSMQGRSVACQDEHGFGFPWLVSQSDLGMVTDMLDEGVRSLQELAQRTKPLPIRLGTKGAWQRWNINTPQELELVRRWVREKDWKGG